MQRAVVGDVLADALVAVPLEADDRGAAQEVGRGLLLEAVGGDGVDAQRQVAEGVEGRHPAYPTGHGCDPGSEEVQLVGSRGSVTLMFCDVEGSTRLVRRLGERDYAIAIATFRRLVRSAVRASDGWEAGCRADELYAAFATAGDAVVAAAAAQRTLTGRSWPSRGEVRARIGLDAGDARHAWRICRAGHGGQVLASPAVRDLAGTQDEFRDLGLVELAGLEEPERVHQLLVPGTRADFPPPRATGEASARRHRGDPERTRPAAAAAQVHRRLARAAADLRAPLAGLDDALFTAERAAAHADGFLGRIDHRRLEKRLAAQREMTVLSDRAKEEAATLSGRIAAIGQAEQTRRRLDATADEATALLDFSAPLDPAALRALRDLLTATTAALDDAVTAAAAVMDPLSFRLARTRHRRIHRVEGCYIVPYVDELGADRAREFDTLSDARDFRDALRITEAAKPRTVPWTVELDGEELPGGAQRGPGREREGGPDDGRLAGLLA